MTKKLFSLALLAMIATSVSAARAEEPEIKGRCGFVATRPLMLLLKSQIIAKYEQLGYKDVAVRLRIKPSKTQSVFLRASNLSGISTISAGGQSPLKVVIQGTGASNPVEIGCTMDISVESVISATNAAGTRSQDTNSNTLLVQGTFR